MREPIGVSPRFNGSSRSTQREPYVELAIKDYIQKRAKGLPQDSPPRPFPRSGKSSFISPSSQKGWGHVEYRPGGPDITWMEERDQNSAKRQSEEQAEKLSKEKEEKAMLQSMDVVTRLEREVKKALDEVEQAKLQYENTLAEIEKKHVQLGMAIPAHQRPRILGAFDYLQKKSVREQQLLQEKERRVADVQKQLTDYLRANPGAGKPTADSESLEKTNAILREQMASMQRQMLILQQQLELSLTINRNNDASSSSDTTSYQPK